MSTTNYGSFTVAQLRVAAAHLSKFAVQPFDDPVDPVLRIRQEAIRGEITDFSGLDGRWQPLMSERQKMLQAECALIGHRWVEQSIQPGNTKGLPVCLFCQLLDKS